MSHWMTCGADRLRSKRSNVGGCKRLRSGFEEEAFARAALVRRDDRAPGRTAKAPRKVVPTSHRRPEGSRRSSEVITVPRSWRHRSRASNNSNSWYAPTGSPSQSVRRFDPPLPSGPSSVFSAPRTNPAREACSYSPEAYPRILPSVSGSSSSGAESTGLQFWNEPCFGASEGANDPRYEHGGYSDRATSFSFRPVEVLSSRGSPLPSTRPQWTSSRERAPGSRVVTRQQNDSAPTDEERNFCFDAEVEYLGSTRDSDESHRGIQRFRRRRSQEYCQPPHCRDRHTSETAAYSEKSTDSQQFVRFFNNGVEVDDQGTGAMLDGRTAREHTPDGDRQCSTAPYFDWEEGIDCYDRSSKRRKYGH